MTVTYSNTDNTPKLVLAGEYFEKVDCTIAQDANRTAALAFGTVMSYDASAQKWSALESQAKTAAVMECGAAGTAVAFAAVSDGEIGVTVDGVDIELTDLDFSNATLLTEVAHVINIAAAGQFWCEYSPADDIFRFISPTRGAASSVSVLVDPDEGGTDITGATYFNGLTGTATAGAGSGGNPDGIYIGDGETAAAIAAADVEDCQIMVAGAPVILHDDQIVLEESGAALTDVVPGLGVSIEEALAAKGILVKEAGYTSGYQS